MVLLLGDPADLIQVDQVEELPGGVGLLLGGLFEEFSQLLDTDPPILIEIGQLVCPFEGLGLCEIAIDCIGVIGGLEIGSVFVVEHDVDDVFGVVFGQVGQVAIVVAARVIQRLNRLLLRCVVPLGFGLRVQVYLDYLDCTVARRVYQLLMDWGNLLRVSVGRGSGLGQRLQVDRWGEVGSSRGGRLGRLVRLGLRKPRRDELLLLECR